MHRTTVAATLWALVHLALTAADPLPTTGGYRGPDCTGVFPGPITAKAFGEDQGLLWKTDLPNWGCDTPLVVGDKVFVNCEYGWKSTVPLLVCLSLETGEILWQQGVDQLDALPPGEQAEAKKVRDQEIGIMNLMLRSTYRYNQAKDGAEKETIIAEAVTGGLANFGKLLEGKNAGKPIRLEADFRRLGEQRDLGYRECLATLREKGWFWYMGWRFYGTLFTGQSFPSLASDGHAVYLANNLGAVARYELDGTRSWLNRIDLPLHGHPYGKTNCGCGSPAISGGVFVVPRFGKLGETACLIGFDCQTGKQLWSTPLEHMERSESAMAFRLDGVDLAYVSGHVFRAEDGKLLGTLRLPEGGKRKGSHTTASGPGTAVALDDLVFVYDQETGASTRQHAPSLLCYRLKLEGDTLSADIIWRDTSRLGGGDSHCLIIDRTKRELYCKEKVFDADSGKLKRQCSLQSDGYQSPVLTTDGKLIGGMRTGIKHDKGPRGFLLGITDAATGEELTKGQFLIPAAAGEKAEQRIAQVGKTDWPWGNARPVPFQGRILLRSNDALYCIEAR